jgi:hypothetical protein
MIFFIDPKGSSPTYHPIDQFPKGYGLTLINTAAGAESLKFEAAGG